jgi:quinol monooxygenase YgiN
VAASSFTFQQLRKELHMFTRIVECQVKSDKRDELTNKLRNEVLPILQKQPGFVELIGLTHNTNPERMVSISMWKSREDAERYHSEHFSRISEMLRPLLKATPIVDTCTVDTSTTHKIAAGRAA